MKKVLLTLFFGIVLVLAACGGAEGGDTEEPTDGSADSKGTEKVSSDDSEESMEAGETKETEDGAITLHKRWEAGETFETGPIVLTIDKVFTASGELEGDVAEMMETDHVEYVQVDVTVENTSEEDITFYAGQGTVATNTGEQLEADMMLSGYIDGDMMAGTKANDSFFYMLENSSAEDVESIRMVFSAPYNTESYDDVGEELDFEINLP